jgi:hypothetical protein
MMKAVTPPPIILSAMPRMPSRLVPLDGGGLLVRCQAAASMRKYHGRQRITVDAVVALTGCDRDAVTAFIRGLYLAGVKDPQAPDF